MGPFLKRKLFTQQHKNERTISPTSHHPQVRIWPYYMDGIGVSCSQSKIEILDSKQKSLWENDDHMVQDLLKFREICVRFFPPI